MTVFQDTYLLFFESLVVRIRVRLWLGKSIRMKNVEAVVGSTKDLPTHLKAITLIYGRKRFTVSLVSL